MLKFLKETERNSSNKKQSFYTCDCGDVSIYVDTVVRNKRREFCTKCVYKKIGEDRRATLDGKIFEKWTVLRYDKTIKRQSYWICECECGNKNSVCGTTLTQGTSKMCVACGIKKRALGRSIFKDGQSADNHRIYRIWKNMRIRCNGSYNTKHYKDVGVTICKEWDDFLVFEKWAKENGYNNSLDIDKDFICDEKKISPKIYSPKTCIFIPKADNARYSALKDLVKKEKLRKEILYAVGILQ